MYYSSRLTSSRHFLSLSGLTCVGGSISDEGVSQHYDPREMVLVIEARDFHEDGEQALVFTCGSLLL